MEKIINRVNKAEEFIKDLKSCNCIDNKHYIKCIEGVIHTNYLPNEFFDLIHNFHITYYEEIKDLEKDCFYFKDGYKLKDFLLTIMRTNIVDCITIRFDTVN